MPIVDINGRPISSEPERVATIADLKDLLGRMGVVAERLAAHHPARALLSESAMWMNNLAQQVVLHAQELATVKEHLSATQEECNRLAQELEDNTDATRDAAALEAVP